MSLGPIFREQQEHGQIKDIDSPRTELSSDETALLLMPELYGWLIGESEWRLN